MNRKWIGLGLVLVSGQALGATYATVNGEKISDKNFRSALSAMPPQQQSQIKKDRSLRRAFLDQLVDQTILVQEAKKKKLDKSAAYRAAVSQFKKQYLASKLLEKQVENKVSDAAAKKYYNQNKNRFSTAQIHTHHILLKTDKKARQVLKQVKKKGADFQKLAEKHSIDPSAKSNRGDLGFLPRNGLDAGYADAAFRAKDGEIIGPIQSAFGYHIIKVVRRKVGKVLEFYEVELQVRNGLRQQMVQTYIGKLKKSAKIKVNDSAIK